MGGVDARRRDHVPFCIETIESIMMETRAILIVEDSDEDFAAIMRAWQKSGIATPALRCTNGEGAIDRLFRRGKYHDLKTTDSPALVVLELNLPGTDGRSVLPAINENEHLKLTPVVIPATSANPADVEVCYRRGANSYILNPLKLSRLREILQNLVSYWMDAVYLPVPKVSHGE